MDLLKTVIQERKACSKTLADGVPESVCEGHAYHENCVTEAYNAFKASNAFSLGG